MVVQEDEKGRGKSSHNLGVLVEQRHGLPNPQTIFFITAHEVLETWLQGANDEGGVRRRLRNMKRCSGRCCGWEGKRGGGLGDRRAEHATHSYSVIKDGVVIFSSFSHTFTHFHFVYRRVGCGCWIAIADPNHDNCKRI